MSFKDIGLKIQLAREEKGLSQEQLARAMGCSQSALSNYEKGKRRLYLSQLEIMSRVLDKPLEYFVESISLKSSAAKENNMQTGLRIVEAIGNLDEGQLKKVMEYIYFLQWQEKGRR